MWPTNSLRSILSHPKDQVPDDDKLGVISCGDCDDTYVSQTGRTWVSEHKRAVSSDDLCLCSSPAGVLPLIKGSNSYTQAVHSPEQGQMFFV